MTKVEQSGAGYIAEVEAWRRDMEQQMRSPGPGGWLAIVGMYPLQTGLNTIGSAPGSDVLLPAGAAPERFGMIDFDGIHGKLEVTTDEPVTVGDVQVFPGQPALPLRNYYEPGGLFRRLRESFLKIAAISGILNISLNPLIRVFTELAEDPLFT